MMRWGAVAYAMLGLLACGASWLWLDHLPFMHPSPWLSLTEFGSHAYSLLIGGAFGSLLVISSRISLNRFEWAQRLHSELRPVAQELGGGAIVLLALASAFGEELLFRGLAQPLIGLVPQALVFGFLHQLPGKSRWVWAAWAALVGLGLGVVFALTGSLIGPIVAHAMVNGLNLAHLKHHDVQPSELGLGGLLAGRSPLPGAPLRKNSAVGNAPRNS